MFDSHTDGENPEESEDDGLLAVEPNQSPFDLQPSSIYRLTSDDLTSMVWSACQRNFRVEDQEPWDQGSVHLIEVNGSYSDRDIESLRDGMYNCPGLTDSVLNFLASKELIPQGTYLIEVTGQRLI